MSKEINWDEPLNDFDRKYALDRGMHKKVRENDERFGDAPKERTLEDVRGELRSARQKVADLEAEEARMANPNVSRPAPASHEFPPVGGTAVVAPVDNTPVDGEAPAGAPAAPEDEYEQWTKQDLIDEIDERNEKDGTKISTSGTKAELIERLRSDDKRQQAEKQ